MITLRTHRQRRHFRRGEQDIWHTFSPERDTGPLPDGFGALAVFDEVELPPGEDTAPRQDGEAETLTYVCEGTLAQEDSTGDSRLIAAGEFRQMTTGHRVRYREINASRTDRVRFFRVALRSSLSGLDGSSQQRRFTVAQRHNLLRVVASQDGRKGSLRVHQDAFVCSGIIDPGNFLVHEVLPGRSVWLHIVNGEATLNHIILTQGYGVGVTNEPSASLEVRESTEILLVDMGPALQLQLIAETPLEQLDGENRQALEQGRKVGRSFR